VKPRNHSFAVFHEFIHGSIALGSVAAVAKNDYVIISYCFFVVKPVQGWTAPIHSTFISEPPIQLTATDEANIGYLRNLINRDLSIH